MPEPRQTKAQLADLLANERGEVERLRAERRRLEEELGLAEGEKSRCSDLLDSALSVMLGSREFDWSRVSKRLVEEAIKRCHLIEFNLIAQFAAREDLRPEAYAKIAKHYAGYVQVALALAENPVIDPAIICYS